MMKIRFTRPFRSYVKGAVVELAGGQAKELVARGYAVEETQQQLLETATIEPEYRTAEQTLGKRRRKR